MDAFYAEASQPPPDLLLEARLRATAALSQIQRLELPRVRTSQARHRHNQIAHALGLACRQLERAIELAAPAGPRSPPTAEAPTDAR